MSKCLPGYQAFWKLKTPIPVNGDLAIADDAARYNQQLELLLGGDNCHNVDRIMRLPGTVNVPDERKRKKGRTPALASLVFSDLDYVYDLERFTAAPVVQMGEGAGFVGTTTSVAISGNVDRLEDVNDLDKWGVPDRIKVIIVQGKHPDDPKQGDSSRSGWLFDVACQLVRRDVPDDVIFSILTDPEFAISESVLEKGSNAERYAVRQIERAKEEVDDPWLRKLNDRYAVIASIGGRCRVVQEEPDPVLKRSRLIQQSFLDFRNSFMNVSVDLKNAMGNIGCRPVGKWWLEHPKRRPKRRQFDRIVFLPGKDIPGSYNMWQGYGCQAQPGDLHQKFLDHIRENVCQGNDEYFRYLVCWMARVIQRPAEPGEVAVMLRGGKGVGKSFFAKQFGRLFGRHFLQVSNASHLVGNFNAHLRDALLLFADEAFYAGDKKHASILKILITEETIQIEAKGVDVETAPNFVHLIMASNDAHVIPASGDERRFFVLDVGIAYQQKAPYFKAIADDLEKGATKTYSIS